MTRSIEETMQEQLWSWLAQRGYEVHGEVSLLKGRIDLVYHDSEKDEYIGVELKNHGGDAQRIHHPAVDEEELANRPAKPGLLAKKYWGQLETYIESGMLDRVYFACQNPSILSAPSGPTDDRVGRIYVPDPFNSDGSIAIEYEAELLPCEETPTFRSNDEPTIQHQIWAELGGIREAVLPNREAQASKRIDILRFTDAIDPTEVYRNQGEQDIIGIEVKGSGPIQSSQKEVQEQLSTYVDSGGLTRVYLGVPVSVRKKALSLLESASEPGLDSVGLYTVSAEGEVTQERSASKQTMYFDGMRVNTGSTHDYVIDIGWGRVNPALPEKSTADYFSIFDTE